MINPTMPSTNRTVPAVWRLIPFTWAVTAHLRIAPTAISRMDVPMVIGQSYPACRRCTHMHGHGRSAAHFAQLALDLARDLAGADRLALVVEVLALGQGDLDLGPRAGA